MVEPIEAKTIDLPIVVEPIEAKTIDLPIVVEPIEAPTISDLPIAMEPIEAPTIRLGVSQGVGGGGGVVVSQIPDKYGSKYLLLWSKCYIIPKAIRSCIPNTQN